MSRKIGRNKKKMAVAKEKSELLLKKSRNMKNCKHLEKIRKQRNILGKT